jgi:Fe-S cluster assembly ATP-binding protein
VSVASFLRTAVNAHRKGGPEGTGDPIRIPEFRKKLQANMELLQIDRSMSSRYLNEGFSGGEKKRLEILQLGMLEPSWPSSTRPTRASTSTHCASWRTA